MNTNPGIIGKKLGMTQFFAEDGNVVRCTVIQADVVVVAKYEVGQPVQLDQVFEVGQFVDVQGTTRGRGFSGVMRRWNFAGAVATHGSHEYKRHGGSIGTNMTPGRTLPGLKMPGHYGHETVSVLNLKVAQIHPDKNLLLIEGGVPGPRNSVVTVRGAVKKKNGGKPKK